MKTVVQHPPVRICAHSDIECGHGCADKCFVTGMSFVEVWKLGDVVEKGDAVNHPKHYNAHPCGVECITVVEHMSFNVGNAMKYLWRADEKGAAIEDLRKAAWYVQREIERRAKAEGATT